MVINVQIKREANIRRCSLSLPFCHPHTILVIKKRTKWQIFTSILFFGTSKIDLATILQDCGHKSHSENKQKRI